MSVQSVHDSSPCNFLLWGGRSVARIASEMIFEKGVGQVIGIYDAELHSPEFETKALFTNNEQELKGLIEKASHFVVCIGGEHGYARFIAASYLKRFGVAPFDLIHHKSFIEPTASVGEGAQIMPGAIVHKFVQIGSYVLINTNSTIDHESILGDGVHIMGGASIAGKVCIGNYATIGTNATVLPSITIGEGAYVGAGAVVTKNVKPYTVVAGVPAMELREIKPIHSNFPPK